MVRKITDFCNREHKQIDKLFKEYLENKGEDLVKTQAYFRKFKCALHKHMNIEEDVLFTPFEEKIGFPNIGPTVMMRREHEEIREILKNVLEKLSKGNLSTSVDEENLQSIFESHGLSEDEVLFSSIEAFMNEDEIRLMIKNLNSYSLGCCRACH